MKSSKLRIKDVITVVLLSLINIAVFSLGTFLYLSPITILLMPVFYSLFQGIVFFVIGVKVPKKGAMFIYCAIQGIIGMNIPYILMYLLAGVLAELILWKTGYVNSRGLTLSYISMQLLACVGSTIYPYAITLNATLSRMHDTGDLNLFVEKAGKMIQSWGCPVLVAVVILSAWLGALLGALVTRRHLLRAKEAAGEEPEEAK